jgi:uncharacterized glyoxalase superfamily protein PhnB
MHATVIEPEGTIVPTLRYRDVAAAIDWLCNAFGFEKHHMVSGEGGIARYAELTFGTGMIMLGPVEESAVDKLMTQPADTGGAETQICYLFVPDADTHCARARAAGAEIMLDIEDEDGGGRGYSCRDLEGHVWNFGTYDPWRRSAQSAEPGLRMAGLGERGRKLALAVGGVVAVVASAVVAGWALGIPDTDHKLYAFSPAGTPSDVRAQAERELREAVEPAAKEVREQLAKERTAREAAERAAKEAGEQLANASAERAADREQVARERSALETARRAADEARERLALAERSADAMNQQLATERSAREGAERVSEQAREQLAREHKQAQEEAKARAAARRAPPPRPRRAAQPTSSRRSLVDWYHSKS